MYHLNIDRCFFDIEFRSQLIEDQYTFKKMSSNKFLFAIQLILFFLLISCLLFMNLTAIELYERSIEHRDLFNRIDDSKDCSSAMNIQGIADAFKEPNTPADSNMLQKQNAVSQKVRTSPIQVVRAVRPENLKKAYLLPSPPDNRGRMIFYETYRIIEESASGKTMIEFNEWIGTSQKKTIVPVDEIRWEAK